MTTHDVLAFAVASRAVQEIRSLDFNWSTVFSSSVHVTTSRNWPQPDFVVFDDANNVAMAAEFKPPAQTKREYLTGLGQAVAYTRDFNYAALIVPDYADDGYDIGSHIESVLAQSLYDPAPLALLTYDPGTISPYNAAFSVRRPLSPRAAVLAGPATLSDSFYAKWREASPDELGRYLEYLYDESTQPSAATGTVRDRAFARLWQEMVTGSTTHWGGGTRSISDTQSNRTGWMKNYRNFASHVNWTLGDGTLAEDGLAMHHVVRRYGSASQVFKDQMASALLLAGKHLVLINAINKYQDGLSAVPDEPTWLNGLEQHLEADGLLKRNPGRHNAATQQAARGFLKAEKQLWRNLGLIVPRGGRVFHPGRGFIFNWERIASLLTDQS